MLPLSLNHKVWSELALCEIEKLKELFGSALLKIDHFGSTSIKGLKAQPIIEIQLKLKSSNDYLFLYSKSISELGYHPSLSHVFIDQVIYVKLGDPKIHLHFIESDSFSYEMNIFFRNRLNNDPELKNEFQKLKEEHRFKNNKIYQKRKNNFIVRVSIEELSPDSVQLFPITKSRKFLIFNHFQHKDDSSYQDLH